ncbi:MAG: hypothetical protein N4A62_07420 [Marinisporobacter sp.]|jgi:hypothetical protein|nr:hypothetical protein [Marinisporobacter sp.]
MKSDILANECRKTSIERIDTQIKLGNNSIGFLNKNSSIAEMEKSYNQWVRGTEAILRQIFKNNQKTKEFLFNVERNINKFSKIESQNMLSEGIESGIKFLQILKEEIDNDKYSGTKESDNGNDYYLERNVALIIVRRILKNFYKHIQVMYQEKIHGKGTIKKEDLSKIKIGNEYDVVIEVKCTRKSMTERNLTEEMGADAFHYKTDYLFFFVYDKENIIKNVDAFTKGYKRKKSDFGTDIEAIVNQPINM